MTEAKVRLFVDHPLAMGQPVAIGAAQANYLFNVMRLGPGDGVLLFNGRDGEWLATVAEAGKRRGGLVCEALTAELRLPPDLWLLFAPIKKARTDFIVEKAVELGVARVVPVQTRRTNAERVRHGGGGTVRGDVCAGSGGAGDAGPGFGDMARRPQVALV